MDGGLPLTDDAILEKTRAWAEIVSNAKAYDKANSTSWLQKFKQKDNIGDSEGRTSSKRHSEAINSDAGWSSFGSSAAPLPSSYSLLPAQPPRSSSRPRSRLDSVDDLQVWIWRTECIYKRTLELTTSCELSRLIE